MHKEYGQVALESLEDANEMQHLKELPLHLLVKRLKTSWRAWLVLVRRLPLLLKR